MPSTNSKSRENSLFLYGQTRRCQLFGKHFMSHWTNLCWIQQILCHLAKFERTSLGATLTAKSILHFIQHSKQFENIL